MSHGISSAGYTGTTPLNHNILLKEQFPLNAREVIDIEPAVEKSEGAIVKKPVIVGISYDTTAEPIPAESNTVQPSTTVIAKPC